MPPENTELRFAADFPLGGLARWLRVMGFDTLWPVDLTSGTERWRNSPRIPLARTRRIRRLNYPRLIFIRPDRPRQQVRQVLRTLGLHHRDLRPFSRCVRCNLRLLPLDRRQAVDRVPDFIFLTHQRFSTCAGCRRIYWPGSHRRRVSEVIDELVGS
jgi:uncharacterized protein with PIN domain